jgi:Ca2+-binding RTX toxin-like protein
VYRYSASNQLQFSLTQITSGSAIGRTTFNVKSALSAVILDAFGTLTFGTSAESVPVASVTSLIVNGENKNESIDVSANVGVTVNAAGGNDTVYTGNSGDYWIDLGIGSNTLHGGNSTDYVHLTPYGYDLLYLGGGDDTVDALYDAGDDDTMFGEAGFDTLLVWIGTDRNNKYLDSIEYIEHV